MEYKIRKLKTVGLRQGAPAAASLEWCPPALRKTAIAIAGFAVLIVGVAFIFLPAPAVLMVPLGLAILARELPGRKKRWIGPESTLAGRGSPSGIDSPRWLDSSSRIHRKFLLD